MRTGDTHLLAVQALDEELMLEYDEDAYGMSVSSRAQRSKFPSRLDILSDENRPIHLRPETMSPSSRHLQTSCTIAASVLSKRAASARR